MKQTIVIIGAILSLMLLATGCGKEEEETELTELVSRSNTIVDGLITVAAGQYQTFRFIVDSTTMSNVLVRGEFTASGGSGNDIITIIMDDIAYTNWINGHKVNALYTSNKVTTDRFTVPIKQSGTYYLVFDNTFSTFTTKTVSASVIITFNEVSQSRR